MEFWDIVKVALVSAVILWWLINVAMELNQLEVGLHEEELSYRISREDRESLTKKDRRKMRRMKDGELTAFLAKRFPNSIPESKTDLELL